MAIADFDISKPAISAKSAIVTLPIPAFSDVAKPANDVSLPEWISEADRVLTAMCSSSTRTSTTPRPACSIPTPSTHASSSPEFH